MRSDSEEAGFERHYCPVIRGTGERRNGQKDQLVDAGGNGRCSKSCRC